MLVGSLFFAATLSSVVVAQQFNNCRQLRSGFGYICSPDRSQVQYCQPDKSPTTVVSQYCGYNDCLASGSQGSCQYGVTQQNHARGPTDCSQVNANGAFICSSDYMTVFQCQGLNKRLVDYCPDGGCFASTTGDQGKCVR